MGWQAPLQYEFPVDPGPGNSRIFLHGSRFLGLSARGDLERIFWRVGQTLSDGLKAREASGPGGPVEAG